MNQLAFLYLCIDAFIFSLTSIAYIASLNERKVYLHQRNNGYSSTQCCSKLIDKALKAVDHNSNTPTSFAVNALATSTSTMSFTRHALPKTEEDAVKARYAAVPVSTQRDTQWFINAWRDWSLQKDKIVGLLESTPIAMLKTTLSHWLKLFVPEVRTKEGNECVPNTLHHLLCGVLQYVRSTFMSMSMVMPNVNFFKICSLQILQDSQL